MSNIKVLDVFLHDILIGTIVLLPGERNLFTFNPEYIEDQHRPTLSLSFKDRMGSLIAEVKSTRTKLPPFFSNLLPEGPLRDFLAEQANVDPEREFHLLAALGNDLPGALKIRLSSREMSQAKKPDRVRESNVGILHFSLAGVQLKFSAIWEKGGKLTVPVNGIGGAWIVKLPSTTFPFVAENEYVMMEMARKIGIDVPETALVHVDQIVGIPAGFRKVGGMAYAIKRFDRTPSGEKVHIEDFAQVFGVYPEQKYKSASYRNIAEVISAEVGEEGIIEFVRRFVFNALIGNGDMHLKNWSLIYPDKRNPALAPAYDFVSTLPYLPEDYLALTFVDSKAFSELTMEKFKRFASKARLSETLALSIVEDTVLRFKQVWNTVESYHLHPGIVNSIEQHLQTVPIFKEF